jgi:cell division protein FtsB
MKKSAKPLILYSLGVFILLAVFLLGYIGTKLKYDQLVREIVVQEETISSLKNRQMFLTARLQYYTSEDQIIKIAESQGLIKREDARIVLEVSKQKIMQINNMLKEKYD